MNKLVSYNYELNFKFKALFSHSINCVSEAEICKIVAKLLPNCCQIVAKYVNVKNRGKLEFIDGH